MPEQELRKLEELLSDAVAYGHWKQYLDQAETVEAVQNVRYSLYETEGLTREQIQVLHKAIDDKEALLSAKESVNPNKKSILTELESIKSRIGEAVESIRPEEKRHKNQMGRQ